MCGILAILQTTRAHTRLTQFAPCKPAFRHAQRAAALLDRLAHRGPDGHGTLALRNAWLGHRRLAIVDPERGQQPFRRGTLAWIANGEIFNHATLRCGLDMHGLSDSDCAVIGPLWQRHGAACPGLLDGEYAFVAVDERSGAWIAARDHVGVCPLYIGWHADGTVWFASEMKALVGDCATVEAVPPGHAWVHDVRGLRCVQWYAPAW